MPSTNIKNLSVTQLLAMRGDIDKLLQSKRSELQAQLAQIGGDGAGIRKAGSVKGMKVAPKYRHPKTGETWSGRGGTAITGCTGPLIAALHPLDFAANGGLYRGCNVPRLSWRSAVSC